MRNLLSCYRITFTFNSFPSFAFARDVSIMRLKVIQKQELGGGCESSGHFFPPKWLKLDSNIFHSAAEVKKKEFRRDLFIRLLLGNEI